MADEAGEVQAPDTDNGNNTPAASSGAATPAALSRAGSGQVIEAPQERHNVVEPTVPIYKQYKVVLKREQWQLDGRVSGNGLCINCLPCCTGGSLMLLL